MQSYTSVSIPIINYFRALLKAKQASTLMLVIDIHVTKQDVLLVRYFLLTCNINLVYLIPIYNWNSQFWFTVRTGSNGLFWFMVVCKVDRCELFHMDIWYWVVHTTQWAQIISEIAIEFSNFWLQFTKTFLYSVPY